MDAGHLWQDCLERLRAEIPTQAFNTWVRPLRPVLLPSAEAGTALEFHLVAPNRFIQDWVKTKLYGQISAIFSERTKDLHDLLQNPVIVVGETSSGPSPLDAQFASESTPTRAEAPTNFAKLEPPRSEFHRSGVNTYGTSVDSEDLLSGLIEQRQSLSALVADGSQERSVESKQENNFAPSLGRSSHSQLDTIVEGKLSHRGALNRESTFDNFVEGKSNQLARAAAIQVAENPGFAYNPLFIYGGVGLGKTHLMHAIGNYLIEKKPNAKVVYLHSETFVATMVTALQLNAINEFKRFYRSVDALLIDDIQFFAGKERSQEEFFHTFNALLEGGQQIILTSDRYHKEINGLEERLKSRFGWGLTVAVEPPELETRAAILMNKAALANVELPNDAAMFIAQRLRSNVRELEGALKRVIAHSSFRGEAITVDLIKEALRDLFTLQDKLVTIDNIQRSVAEYYKIKMSDMLSKRRNRSVARPRQVAMCLSKELTNHSLPEIGDAFGGRDHTTVMHACKQIAKLRQSTIDIEEDYNNLLRLLSS